MPYLALFFVLLAYPAFGQSTSEYQQFMQSGQREMEQGRYEVARRKFRAAAEYGIGRAEREAAQAGLRKTEQLQLQAVERERDKARAAQTAVENMARRADTLQAYLQGENTYRYFLGKGIHSFRLGSLDQARFDLATARFMDDTEEVRQWLRLVMTMTEGFEAAKDGRLEESLPKIKWVAAQDSFCTQCSMLQADVEASIQAWEATVAGRPLDLIDSFHIKEMRFLPVEIARLTNVKKLKIQTEYIGYWPVERLKQIGSLPNLQTLDMSGCELGRFPLERWRSLLHADSKIRSVDLSYNPLESFPSALLDLENLEDLDLSGCRLTAIPRQINRLKNLNVLILSRNEIKDLPETFEELTGLEYLDLSYSYMTELPEPVTKLPSLKKFVFIAATHISPKFEKVRFTNLGRMAQLEELVLIKHPISNFSTELSKLTNLKVLHMGSSNFKLESFNKEAWSFLKNLSNLRYLYLTYEGSVTITEVEFLLPYRNKIIKEIEALLPADCKLIGLNDDPSLK